MLPLRKKLEKFFFNLAESVGRRLRNAGMKAGMLSVEIRYHTFRDNSHQKQLLRSTNNDMEIYDIAMELFREFWNGEPIRLLGLRSSKLVHEDEPEQMSLLICRYCIAVQGKTRIVHRKYIVYYRLNIHYVVINYAIWMRHWIRYEKSMAMML